MTGHPWSVLGKSGYTGGHARGKLAAGQRTDLPPFSTFHLSVRIRSSRRLRRTDTSRNIVPPQARVHDRARRFDMRARTRRLASLMAALGIALTGATGCQTWYGGMTLPEWALPATLPAVLRAGPASPPPSRACQPGRPRRRGALRGRLQRRAAAGRSGSARAGRRAPARVASHWVADAKHTQMPCGRVRFFSGPPRAREPGLFHFLAHLLDAGGRLDSRSLGRYCPGSDGCKYSGRHGCRLVALSFGGGETHVARNARGMGPQADRRSRRCVVRHGRRL